MVGKYKIYALRKAWQCNIAFIFSDKYVVFLKVYDHRFGVHLSIGSTYQMLLSFMAVQREIQI